MSAPVHSSHRGSRDQARPPEETAGNPKDPYMLPRLASEVNRLDLQHYALREALGTNYLAPVSSPARILDVGTGTGQWAFELSREFPGAATVGVDLGRTVKPSAPESYWHVQANAAEGLPFRNGAFDFVHQRLLRPGIPAVKWPCVVRDLARVTRSGGWVELVEVGDGIAPAGPATRTLFDLLVRLCARFGLVVNLPRELALDELLSGSGMVAIETRRVDIPVGEWAGRPGSFMASDARAAFTALTPTFESLFSIPRARTHELVRAMIQEVEEVHGTLPMYYAWGQRPE